MPGCKECQYLDWDLVLGRPICRVVNAEINTWTYGDDCIKFAQKPDLSKILKSSDNIISQIGLPAVLEQLGEECCELGQAALKMARKLRGENPTPKSEDECLADLAEEMSDVRLCIDILLKDEVVDPDAIKDIAEDKHQRWIKRLKEEKNNGKEN